MNFTKVLQSLKTNKKIASLGFSRKELRGIAQEIADNSDLADDATEDDENTAITDAIDGMLPILKIGQQYAMRLANESDNVDKKKPNKKDDDDDDGDDDENQPKPKPKSKLNDGDGDDSAVMKMLREMNTRFDSIDERFKSLSQSRDSNDRKGQVTNLLKEAKLLDGKFGQRALRNFERQSKKMDKEDFEAFLEDLQDDIDEASENNEDDDSTTHQKTDITSIVPPKKSQGKSKNVATDKEIDDLASSF